MPPVQPEDSVWFAADNLLNPAPTDAFNRMVEDDFKKLHDSVVDAGEIERVAERSLILDVYLIQGWYRSLDSWKQDVAERLAIAMGTSAFNHLMLARHAIRLGYYAETGALMRQAHEYTTRCLLFPLDREASDQFASGQTITQAEVDRRLDRLMPELGGQPLRVYRRNYRRASVFAHPNLAAISLRNPNVSTDDFHNARSSELAAVAGLDTAVGGITVGISIIQGFTELSWRAHALSVALMRGFADYGGYWQEHFDVLGKHIDSAFDALAPRRES